MKVKIFMAVTAVIAAVNMYFNIFLDNIIVWLSKNLYDEYVYTYGPYYKSVPIDIDLAMIDGDVYTNKTRLLMHWKWNFDIVGVIISDILLMKPNASKIILRYKKKYSTTPDRQYICIVDITSNKIIEDNSSRNILFEEIRLC